MRPSDQQRIAGELMRSPELIEQAIRTKNGKNATPKGPWWERVPDLDAVEHREIEWLVEDFIPRRAFVLLVGVPGSYKSWIALDVARAVAKGERFAGRRTIRNKVMYIDRENPQNVIALRRDIWTIEEVPTLRYLGRWVPLQAPSIQSAEMRDYAREIKPLIIFDSLKRFHSANENDNSEMSKVMENFIDLTTLGATVFVLHHGGREGKNARGAIEIEAAPDICYRADRDNKSVTLSAFKNRIGDEKSFTVHWTPFGFDVPAREGEPR